MIRKKVADEIYEVRFLPSGKLFGIVRVGERYRFVYWSLPNFEEELIYETPPQPEAEYIAIDLSIASKAKYDIIAVSFRAPPEVSLRFVVRGFEICAHEVGGHEELSLVALAPDGKSLLYQVEDDVIHFEWSEQEFQEVNEEIEVSCGNWEDCRIIGFGQNKRHLIIWDSILECVWMENLNSGKTLLKVECNDPSLSDHRITPDSASSLLNLRKLCFVDLTPKGSKERSAEELQGSPLLSEARSFALHPDKDKVIFSKQTGQIVYVYSRKEKAIVEKFNWARETICGLDYSYDGLLAACGTINGNLIVWDVDT